MKYSPIFILFFFFHTGCFAQQIKKDSITSEKVWKEKLTSEQYYVLREKGTESPFTGKYYKSKENGVYICAGCENLLFISDTKFNSGSGWPSFYAPISDTSIVEHSDKTHGMIRIEVTCAVCSGHLGHVFNDGPKPTGLRYCINSVSLGFVKK